jgi:cysteine desulfurase
MINGDIMPINRVYIDYNATTPLRPEVKAAMISDLDIYGNASSIHSSGRLARARIEEARSDLAALLGAPSESIVFCSGGSESNNTVFHTMRHLAKKGRNEFITTAIEHPCVLSSGEYTKELGFKVNYIPVDETGKIKMDAYRAALSEKTLFVSVMMANNEIGTIQDIKEISRLAKEAGAFVHSDAVQAAGKIPVNVTELGLDYLSVSAHKIYGPKGVGALYVRKGAPLFPLIRGGHQEEGFRSGTYNNMGILGFGKAAALALQDLDEYRKKTSALRDYLRDGLLAKSPSIRINGHPLDVLPNTLNVSFPGAEGEAILLSMDIAGIEASTGSACASGSLEPSHVLMAMGLGPELAHGSIRFSLGRESSREDVDYILETLPPIIEKLRAMSTVKTA